MTSPTVYLDHAATTPMVPAAVAAMTEHLLDVGNPSSLHASGRRARRIVEESRETIARVLGCGPGEVVFTSGGTEADQPSALREAALAGAGGAEAAAAAALDPSTSSPTRSAAGSPGGNAETVVKAEAEKIGRNDPCWCGSGKKFKKCHGA